MEYPFEVASPHIFGVADPGRPLFTGDWSDPLSVRPGSGLIPSRDDVLWMGGSALGFGLNEGMGRSRFRPGRQPDLQLPESLQSAGRRDINEGERHVPGGDRWQPLGAMRRHHHLPHEPSLGFYAGQSFDAWPLDSDTLIRSGRPYRTRPSGLMAPAFQETAVPSRARAGRSDSSWSDPGWLTGESPTAIFATPTPAPLLTPAGATPRFEDLQWSTVPPSQFSATPDGPTKPVNPFSPTIFTRPNRPIRPTPPTPSLPFAYSARALIPPPGPPMTQPPIIDISPPPPELPTSKPRRPDSPTPTPTKPDPTPTPTKPDPTPTSGPSPITSPSATPTPDREGAGSTTVDRAREGLYPRVIAHDEVVRVYHDIDTGEVVTVPLAPPSDPVIISEDASPPSVVSRFAGHRQVTPRGAYVFTAPVGERRKTASSRRHPYLRKSEMRR